MSSTLSFKNPKSTSTLLLSNVVYLQRRLREQLQLPLLSLFLPTHLLGYREMVGEYGSKPLYKMLGYFSIIGLLRVHTLLGDYTLALKVMDNIELNQKV